jgi:putative ABC transport system permease protein
MSEDGGLFAQANFAAVFAPMETAQALSGRAGRVNDLVLRVRPGSDVAATAQALERAFDGAGLAITVMDQTTTTPTACSTTTSTATRGSGTSSPR